MDWWLITFLLGALLSLFFPTVPTLFSLCLFFTISLLIFYFKRTRKWSAFFFGITWLMLHGTFYQVSVEQQVATNFKNKKMVVIGRIENIAHVKSDTQRFNFVVSKVEGKKLESAITIRLSWKNLTQLVEQGQQWQLKVRLKPAHGLANVGGFSYQTWLRKNKTHATGYVVKSKENLLKVDSPYIRQQLYNSLNELLDTLPSEHLSKNGLTPLILALSFGERGQLTKDHWQVIQRTATQHLIAISGLHLGLVAGSSFLLFSWIMRLVPWRFMMTNRLNQKIILQNNRLIIIGLSCFVTLIYAYLAGFSIPTLRALIMLSMFWLARIFGSKFSITRWLLITLCIIVFCMPFSLFSISFWLSFYAVSTIFIIIWRFSHIFNNSENLKTSIFCRIKHWLSRLLFLQVSLIALMLPLTVTMSHQLSLVAIPANLIAVPWMSFTSIPLSLLSVLFLPFSETIAQFFIYLSIRSLDLLWLWLSYLSEFSLASYQVSNSSWLIGVACLIALSVLIMSNINLKQTLVLLLLLLSPIIFIQQVNQPSKNWKINVMDVGQGLAVIVEANEKVLIYDTGASFPSGFSMAEAVIIPYLLNQGYREIDKLIISHDDNDHAGGLALLKAKFKINSLMYNKNNEADSCIKGETQTWQFLSLEVLSPNIVQAEHNDDSCVVKISDNNYSLLLTGDISRKVEGRLVKEYELSDKLKSNLLVVPHHGSKTSSSHSFIASVAPQIAVFSAGYLNRWKMPMASVVKRYHDKNIKTFSTAANGMIRFEIEDNQVHIKPYRQQLWPFWFAN